MSSETKRVPDAFRRDRASEVGNVQRNVMQSFATLLEETRDRRLGRSRLQQLDAALADGHHRQPHLLPLDGLLRHDLQAELLVELPGFRQRLHGDSEMVNVVHSGFPNSSTIFSTREYGSRLCSATSAA